MQIRSVRKVAINQTDKQTNNDENISSLAAVLNRCLLDTTSTSVYKNITVLISSMSVRRQNCTGTKRRVVKQLQKIKVEQTMQPGTNRPTTITAEQSLYLHQRTVLQHVSLQRQGRCQGVNTPT